MDEKDARAHVRQELIDAARGAAPDAAAKLGIAADDEDAQLVIYELCIAMFNAGVRTGSGQVLAQLAEQGGEFTVNMDPSLLRRPGD